MRAAWACFSLGVQLVCIAAASAQDAPLLTVRPDLRIDGESKSFSRIVHLAVSDNGTIVVAQPDDGALRFFDARGNEKTAFGRKGEGPGEFQSIGIYRGWKGTSFWQADILLGRATLLDSAFKLSSTVRLPPMTPSGAFMLPAIVGMLPGGDLLVHATFRRPTVPPEWAKAVTTARSYIVVRVTSRGQVVRLLSAMPQTDDGCMTMVNGRNRPVPECAQSFGAASSTGEFYATVDPSTGGPNIGTYTVTVVGATGELRFRVQLRYAARQIGKAEADSIRRARTVGVKSDLLVQDYMDMPLPKVFRPVHGIIASRDGTVWIALRPDPTGKRWIRLDRKGKPTGSIVVPHSMTLQVITGTQAWGVDHDDDGIPSVVRYRIGS